MSRLVLSDILIEILGPILILDSDEVSKFVEMCEGLKYEVLVELACVEGKISPFSLLTYPNLIEIPNQSCMSNLLCFSSF